VATSLSTSIFGGGAAFADAGRNRRGAPLPATHHKKTQRTVTSDALELIGVDAVATSSACQGALTRPPRASSVSASSSPSHEQYDYQLQQQQLHVPSKLPAVVQGSGAGNVRGADAMASSFAPELRKYAHHSSSTSSLHRPSSRQSHTNEYDVVPTGAGTTTYSARPSSQCSSLGPSASEVSAQNSLVQRRLATALSTTATAPPPRLLPPQHNAAVALDRSQHRREVLDHELADIQRALETRLGMTSSTGAHSPGRASSPASFNASQSSKRSATALAYYSAVPDEHRHPAQDRRELAMHLAMERHRDAVKRRELEEARNDAARGAKEAQAILARVDTELLRRANAEQLTNDLNAQKYFHSLRRDGRGRMTADVETSIMRPTPSPAASSPHSGSGGGGARRGSIAIPSTSVAALGSDPDSVVIEKRAERAKRRAYGADLDSINAALTVAKTTQRQVALLLDQKLLAENAAELQHDKEQKLFKKASFRQHYVEAWNMQRKIANSPSAKMIEALDDGEGDNDAERRVAVSDS
jgi:hypothetical protein